MKNAIVASTLFLCSFFLIGIVGMINTQSIKVEELYIVSERATKETMAYFANNEETATLEKIEASLNKQVSNLFNSDGTMKVDILTFDKETGVLSVNYTSKWKQINGVTRTLSVKKSMLIDKQKQ